MTRTVNAVLLKAVVFPLSFSEWHLFSETHF